ncbi:unnamed protein product, partial [Mesorhabditis belari]|uniref:eIF-4F 25 kDa subunit n=1 Tax=Mesorhabditis belari TaxID=2138241 RepID=A0AAF3J9N0_9BILA
MSEIEKSDQESAMSDQESTPRSLHPLKNTWTYWYLNDQHEDWESRLKRVCSVSTVEEFWALQNNIKPPSMLKMTCDYNFFKNDIQPMWEVPENKNGGRWLIALEKNASPEMMDIIWIELVTSMIGEQYGEDMEKISGLVCNVRNKGSKISMWTSDHNDDDANMRIGKIIARTLKAAEIPEALQKKRFVDMIRYEDHLSYQNKTGSAPCKPKLLIDFKDLS